MCLGCDLFCWFSCISCCCCQNFVTKRLVYFPPSQSYHFQEGISEIEEKTDFVEVDPEEHIFNESDKQLSFFYVRYDGLDEDDEDLENAQKVAVAPYDMEEVQCQFLRTSRKTVIASYFALHPDAEYTILFSHGNATDIGLMRSHLMELKNEVRVNVFAYEYSGYGLSTGKVSQKNSYADIEAAYMFLTKSMGIPPEKIIAYGQSLGSGVTCYLAQKFKLGGIVLHSPLLSGLRVVRDIDKMYWFDIYPSIQRIQNVRVPVFVIHGQVDDAIKPEHGVTLSRLAPNGLDPWIVEGAGHNDIEELRRNELFRRLREYVEYLETRTVQDDGGGLVEMNNIRTHLEGTR